MSEPMGAVSVFMIGNYHHQPETHSVEKQNVRRYKNTYDMGNGKTTA